MRILRTLFGPAHDLLAAVLMPFKALAVVGLCAAINAMTSPGHWWFKWVALGMGIAVLVAWLRAARTLLALALVAWVARWVQRRWGTAARAQFDDWAARTQPKPAELLRLIGDGTAPGAGLPTPR